MKPNLKEVTIFVTNKCNLKCKSCFLYGVSNDNGTYDFDKSKDHLNYSDFVNIVDQVTKISKGCTFFIMGGEPLLHKDIIRMIQYIKSKSPNSFIDINTNGILLKTMCEDLMKAGLDAIVVSIDGSTPKESDYNRGEGVFNESIESIKYFNEVKKRGEYPTKLTVNTVVTNLNYKGLSSMVNLCNELDVDVWYLSFPYFVLEEEGKFSELYLEKNLGIKIRSWKGLQVREVCQEINTEVLLNELNKIDNANKKFELYKNPFGFSNEVMVSYFTNDWKKSIEVNKCNNLYVRTCITANGDVVPCTVFNDMSLGNIKSQKFEDIWLGAKYEKYRELMSSQLHPICYRCCDLLDESDGDLYRSK